MPKHVYFQTRSNPEEQARMDCIKEKLGLKSKAAVLSFLVAEKYAKLFGNQAPTSVSRTREFINDQEIPY